MGQLYPFITQESVITFLLLFIRFSSLFIFMPFFSHTQVPSFVKSGLATYFAILFYSIIPPVEIALESDVLIAAIISEATFGFVAGLLLSMVFAAVGFAGEQISMVMGLSMASQFDPQTQQSSQLISVFLSFFTLMVLLASNGHHLMIEYIDYSLKQMPPGHFKLTHGYLEFIILSVKNIFLIGFTIAFPVMALSLLSDIIFGMIMKTMPSFNLMVVGMPIKIILGVGVIMATLGSLSLIFKHQFTEILNRLLLLL